MENTSEKRDWELMDEWEKHESNHRLWISV